jgi:REP element-mobilizing transposase RayT
MGRRGRANLTDEQFFFVTTTVVEYAHAFAEDKYCDILIDQLKRWQVHFQFAILGYVIMPSHFHWIVKVEPGRGTISDIMRKIKAHAAWAIMDKLERDGNEEFRALFENAGKGFEDQRRRFWMKRFDDQVIRNQRMFMAKLQYIHDNPVKAGLVERAEQYKYSSARNYINDDRSIIYVDTSFVG